ncbi:IS5 family transposase [Micromonospora sp. NPDC050397]|uniref:IS5 family transposase n=1 Tax=Micromonospora sp. NPDC050397 TaxID=3364279 RepID=UPI00384FD32F
MTERRAYPCDLSDARWALIAPRLIAWRQARTDAGVSGRAPTHDLREIFNAILTGDREFDRAFRFYVSRTGIDWRYLPHDFPPYRTVYGYFAAWSKEGIFTELNYDLTGLVRDHHGRTGEPAASIMDSQSVKISTNIPLSTHGTDAGKKIVGRKRGIITDTLGLLLAVIVTAASASDNTIGMDLLDQATATYPALTTTWVDAGFQEQGRRTRRRTRRRRRDRHQGPTGQRIQRGQTPIGRRTHPRLAYAPPSTRARLRSPTQQLRQHDHSRNDRQPHQTASPPKSPQLRDTAKPA